ncbi:MAG: PAS domain S-box protein, partial [Rhodoferax sp.]|uniref:PAS domain S-box protein n=1 Tax=Rhodoferax sp. TaxID=50421 RepID=UPI002735A827
MRQHKPTQTEKLWRNIKLLMAAWSLVIGASLVWSLFYQHRSFETTLHTQAAAFHTMEMEYRNWIIHSGGVYVPVTDKTLPSPWLSETPERDITTPSGKQLTLLNSSSVVRLVHEAMTGADSPLRGHIASLKPINPVNAADAWERQALQAFARGEQEWTAVEVMDDSKSYFRYIKPMLMEQACLKCHAQYGAKLGDIHGGVSVSVPIDGVLLDEQRERNALLAGHGLIWGIGLFGLFVGGSRQQRANAQAEQSEAQVTLLTNAIAHAIYGINKLGNCTFANDACVRLLGFRDKSELLGKNMHELVHHSHADGSPYRVENCPIFAAFQQGKTFYVENEVLWRKDGSAFPVTYWSYPVMQEGRPQGAVVTFLDITEPLRVKGELKHSQALLNSIIENIPAMVFLKRAEDLRFELFNHAGEQLLGYSRNDLLGKNDHDLFPQEQADFFTQKDRAVLESHRLQEVLEEPSMTADGSEKWLRTFKVGLYDEADHP